jgi:peptidyl-dipeptidase Dcp
MPLITYADNRELRKEIAIAFGKKAFQDNSHNNTEILKKIVALRHERAQLLGYATHAHFVLEERMAQHPDQVKSFLNDLLAKAKPAAQREFAQLSAFAKEKDGLDHLEKWDGAYYSEKLKQQLFNLDDELLKPYFKLENVLNGAFTIAQKLFDLKFHEIDTIDKYHPDVQTYEVRDEANELVALFYADFFPRSGKRKTACIDCL